MDGMILIESDRFIGLLMALAAFAWLVGAGVGFYASASSDAKKKRSAWDNGYQLGVLDERISQTWTDGAVKPNRVNPYETKDA